MVRNHHINTKEIASISNITSDDIIPDGTPFANGTFIMNHPVFTGSREVSYTRAGNIVMLQSRAHVIEITGTQDLNNLGISLPFPIARGGATNHARFEIPQNITAHGGSIPDNFLIPAELWIHAGTPTNPSAMLDAFLFTAGVHVGQIVNLARLLDYTNASTPTFSIAFNLVYSTV